MRTGASQSIDGVVVRPLTIVSDDRGAVLHMLRADDPQFVRFGEIYFSVVNPAAVKAWRRHREMVLHYAVPRGHVRVVVFDDRPASPTRGAVMEIETGESRYSLITIPAGTWNGFMGLGDQPSLVANCASTPHDPAEVERRPHDDPSIPYVWSMRGR